MDTSIATAAEKAAAKAGTGTASSTPAADGKSDLMEFELALQLQDIESKGFDGAVAAAVDSVGGELLFDMPLPAETDCRHVAAVSLGTGRDRALMLVMLPKEGEALRVETVEESSHPVAGIVAAYAGLKDHLGIAA